MDDIFLSGTFVEDMHEFENSKDELEDELGPYIEESLDLSDDEDEIYELFPLLNTCKLK